MHIPKATKEQILNEVRNNAELAAYLGGIALAEAMELDELRENVTEWILNGDEAGTVTEIKG